MLYECSGGHVHVCRPNWGFACSPSLTELGLREGLCNYHCHTTHTSASHGAGTQGGQTTTTLWVNPAALVLRLHTAEPRSAWG